MYRSSTFDHERWASLSEDQRSSLRKQNSIASNALTSTLNENSPFALNQHTSKPSEYVFIELHLELKLIAFLYQ